MVSDIDFELLYKKLEKFTEELQDVKVQLKRLEDLLHQKRKIDDEIS